MSIPFDARWVSDPRLEMPFDQYQRYRLMAEIVTVLKQADGVTGTSWRILDVGGYFPTKDGVLPLPAWMPEDETLVVDTIAFDGDHYQQASGLGLPFEDASWDIVISCDTLEHIPADGRGAFLQELRRVARRAVILAAPHAMPGVQSAEHALAEYLRSFEYQHQMLSEHFAYGIPDPAWVDGWLHEQSAAYTAFPSGYLPRWQLMMFLKHLTIAVPEMFFLHERLDQTYNERFYERDQRAPGYRRVYVIAAPGTGLPDLTPFVQRSERPEPDDVAADLLGLSILPLVRATTIIARSTTGTTQRLAALEASHKRIEQLVSEMSTTTAQALTDAGRLQAEKQALQQQIELLTWQNQLLHAQLQGPLRRVLTAVGQTGRKLLRRRSS